RPSHGSMHGDTASITTQEGTDPTRVDSRDLRETRTTAPVHAMPHDILPGAALGEYAALPSQENVPLARPKVRAGVSVSYSGSWNGGRKLCIAYRILELEGRKIFCRVGIFSV